MYRVAVQCIWDMFGLATNTCATCVYTYTYMYTRTRTWVHVHFHVCRQMLALSSWLSYGYLNFILFTVILKAFHEKAPACLRSQPQKLCFVSFITLLCLRSSFTTLLNSVSISTLPLRPYSATFVGKASNEIIFTRSKIEEHILPPSQRLTQQPGWETQLLDVTKAPNLFVSHCLC